MANNKNKLEEIVDAKIDKLESGEGLLTITTQASEFAFMLGGSVAEELIVKLYSFAGIDAEDEDLKDEK